MDDPAFRAELEDQRRPLPPSPTTNSRLWPSSSIQTLAELLKDPDPTSGSALRAPLSINRYENRREPGHPPSYGSHRRRHRTPEGSVMTSLPQHRAHPRLPARAGRRPAPCRRFRRSVGTSPSRGTSPPRTRSISSWPSPALTSPSSAATRCSTTWSNARKTNASRTWTAWSWRSSTVSPNRASPPSANDAGARCAASSFTTPGPE